MIHIQEHHYLGKGGFQKCYINPENDELCLKIKIDKNHKAYWVGRKKIKTPFITKH